MKNNVTRSPVMWICKPNEGIR